MADKTNNLLIGVVSAAIAKAYLFFPSAPIVKKKNRFSPSPKKRLQ